MGVQGATWLKSHFAEKVVGIYKKFGNAVGKYSSKCVPKIAIVYYEAGETQDQVAQECCRISIPRNIPDPTGQHSKHHTIVQPAWNQRLE